MKTCDYCEKEIMYDCSAVLKDGIVRIYACDEHKHIAVLKRDAELFSEQSKERAKAYGLTPHRLI